MKNYTQFTAVVFRMWPEGSVIALFPYEITPGGCVSYEHIGQHGAADYPGVLMSTRPATPEESEPLRAELTALGYNLSTVKRRDRRRLAAAHAAFDALHPTL